MPYITAQTWADICFFMFLGACIYQVVYIIYLRRKENISLGRSVAKYFLYAFGSLFCLVIYEYADLFFNGYKECSFLGECYETYYGFEAWKHDDIGNFVYGIVLLVCFVYYVSYYIISKKLKKSNK